MALSAHGDCPKTCIIPHYRPRPKAALRTPREYSELPSSARREATAGASQHRARKAPSNFPKKKRRRRRRLHPIVPSKSTVSSQRCPFPAASASGFWRDAVQRPDQTHPATPTNREQQPGERDGASQKVAGPPGSTGQEPGPGRNVTVTDEWSALLTHRTPTRGAASLV